MTPLDRRCLPIILLGLLLAVPVAGASDAPSSSPISNPQSPIPKETSDAAKYTLRYKFQPGETLRWIVVDRNRVQATYAGSTQTIESVSRSTKCWRVVETDPPRSAVFENSVEDMEMRQQMTGQKPVRYNSKTDKTPPRGLEAVAQRVGKPLTRIKIGALGETIERKPLLPEPRSSEKPQLTIPLPEGPIAVGETWRRRDTVTVPLETGATKSILTQKVFTLTSVKTGVATIEFANEVLTPIHSPEIEAKIIVLYTHGTARFDIDAGRVLSLQTDLDRQVIGFRGADSSVHHLARSTEEFVPAEAAVATRPDEPKSK